jgi:putrescine aminotransferase
MQSAYLSSRNPAGFDRLQAGDPHMVNEIRQRGLMMGLKLTDPACGPLLTLAGFQHGLLTIYANNDTSVSQILPPLVIQPDEVEQVLGALDRMLAWVEAVVS